MIAPTLSSLEIGRGEQSVHLWLFQVRNEPLGALFEGDCANLLAPRDMLRAANGHEMTERVNCRQTLIARGCTAAAGFFKVNEKPSHTLLRYVKHGEFINLLVDLSRGERDQQSERISIAPLRVHRQVAFPDEMFQEKTAYPRAESGSIIHGSPPEMRRSRSEHSPAATTPASSSDNAGYCRYWCGPCRLTAAAGVFAHLFPPDTKLSVGGRLRSGADRAVAAGSVRRQRGGCQCVCEVVETPAEGGRSVCVRRVW